MLRKTKHCSFKSWTFDVRSVPSHWRESQMEREKEREGGGERGSKTIRRHRETDRRTNVERWSGCFYLNVWTLDWQLLTTTLMCFDRSLELRIRKSENAVCMRDTHKHADQRDCLRGVHYESYTRMQLSPTPPPPPPQVKSEPVLFRCVYPLIHKGLVISSFNQV